MSLFRLLPSLAQAMPIRAMLLPLLLVLLAVLAGVSGQSDVFSCQLVQPDPCTIQACRCNSFRLTQLQYDNVTGYTRVAINVTNLCQDPFVYAAFSPLVPIVNLTGWVVGGSRSYGGGTSVTSTGLPNGGDINNQGFYQNNYAWKVTVINGTAPWSTTSPALQWIRFGGKQAYDTSYWMSSQSAWNDYYPPWEVFAFQIANYTLGGSWAFQGHQGSLWDTFINLDFSACNASSYAPAPATPNPTSPPGTSSSNATLPPTPFPVGPAAAISFVPEPCPDLCGGSFLGGRCLNTSSSSSPSTPTCQCNSNRTGVNCLANLPPQPSKVAMHGGVITAIVVLIVVGIGFCTFLVLLVMEIVGMVIQSRSGLPTQQEADPAAQFM